MKEVRLYGALIGITVIVAAIAFFQAFVSCGEPAAITEGAALDQAPGELPDSSPAQGSNTGTGGEELAAIDAAKAWVESLYATDMPAQDYLARLCSLSQSAFAKEIQDCFGYHTAVGEENELLAEARACISYGYSNPIEISGELINIDGSQAGFSCQVLAHYPGEDSRFQLCAYLVREEGAWKVADAFRRY